MISRDVVSKCIKASHNMRVNILLLARHAGANGAHLGSALSIVEIMSVLYLHVMHYNPSDPFSINRDRFVLSKGHGALGLYTALFEAGIITKDELFTYEENGGDFPGQPSKSISHGIEFSGGSLGLGLSYACGIALGAKRMEKCFRTYVLMGDGEVNEGSVWESVMFAKHNALSNLIVIIDRNNMQSDGTIDRIMNIDMEAIWRGYGWNVVTCMGHDFESLINAFSHMETNLPTVIIANTIKGKGISFMENSKEWHHNRLSDALFDQAMNELGKVGCSSDGV